MYEYYLHFIAGFNYYRIFVVHFINILKVETRLLS